MKSRTTAQFRQQLASLPGDIQKVSEMSVGYFGSGLALMQTTISYYQNCDMRLSGIMTTQIKKIAQTSEPIVVEGDETEIIPPEEIAESEAAWQDYLAGRDSGISLEELEKNEESCSPEEVIEVYNQLHGTYFTIESIVNE